MSTRSINIVRENGQATIFWMHWDGATAADTILGWSDEQRKFAMDTIRKGIAEGKTISSISTKECLEYRLESAMDVLKNALFNLDSRHLMEYAFQRLRECDFVCLVPYEGSQKDDLVEGFTCDAGKLTNIKTVEDVFALCKAETGKDICTDVQIGNFIDFDNGVCSFDYEIYNDATNGYRKINFFNKATFDDVVCNGQEACMARMA